MYSWGASSNGELGLGGLEDPHVSIPSSVKIHDIKPSSIAIGGRHTLVLTESGQVYSCGCNEFGQLGREGGQTRLEQIVDLSSYTIKSIACGLNHSLAVDEWGTLFSWGSDEFGQLGHNLGGGEEECVRKPKQVKSMATLKECFLLFNISYVNIYNVRHVSAGNQHSLALTGDSHVILIFYSKTDSSSSLCHTRANGQLYTWGSNTKGQLGLGPQRRSAPLPVLVESLEGIPLAYAVCGGFHSMVSTLSGAIFAFGANSNGQLGITKTEDRFFPTEIKSLRKQRIAPAGLAAGSEHSLALTEEGGVFSWGSNRYGQLGRRSAQEEFDATPTRIVELMGTTVTQIAGGGRHSLALVPSGNKLYAFGYSIQGQLGRQTYKTSDIPQVIEGKFNGDINLLAAGANSNWLAVNGKNYSQLTREPAIKVLDTRVLKLIKNIGPDEPLCQDLIEELELIFSSLSCLNGSLLLPTHSGCSGNNNGVDFSGWMEAFTIIRDCPNDTIQTVVMSGLLSALGQLKPSPPDLETLRFYLIMPMHSSFLSPTNTDEFQLPYASSILTLPEPAGKAIEKWFGKAPVEWLSQLIKTYLKVVDPYLQILKSDRNDPLIYRALQTALIFLTLLKRVNAENGSRVSIETFYLTNLHQYYDIKKSYFNWKMARMQGKDITTEFYICNFPFIFDPIAKEMILMADQEYSQQMAQQSEFQNAVFQFMTSGANQVVHPFLQIIVSRDNIVQDTITQLQFYYATYPNTFKKPLKVTFAGEEAEDEGGVTKEFFLLLIKEILNPDYGMFKEYEESRTVWFNPASFEASELFNMIGIVCGLAIYNFTIINLPFPLTLYKKILGEDTEDISDLAELSPLTAKSLQNLLDYKEDDFAEVFSLNFTISESYFGEVVSKPLKPDGENIEVTQENKEEYVKLYINYILNSSCKSHFDAFKDGFLKVVNKQVLQLFQAKELMALVIGNENYNWDEFRENCEYKEPYHKDHEVILMFWRAFKLFNKQKDLELFKNRPKLRREK